MAAGLTHRLGVGDPAPDFELRATRAGADGKQEKCTFRLSDHRGKPVALTFTMAAFTSVWSEQLRSVERSLARFRELGAVVAAISVDNVDSLRAWCGELGTSYCVCSDFWPHGLVSLAYDVLRSNGVADRAWFLVDGEGIVRFAELYPANQVPPDDGILAALRRLPSSPG